MNDRIPSKPAPAESPMPADTKPSGAEPNGAEPAGEKPDDPVPAEYFWAEVRANGRLQVENKALREEVEQLSSMLDAAEAGAPHCPAPPEYEPFPLDALPQVPQAYVRAAAAALDVPPALVAVPMLAVLSSGVGASARLQLKESWTEPATLWTAVVAPSGATKSASMRHALRPVYRHEAEALERYRAALARYDPDGDEPKPVRTRYRMGDPTPEAVVRILEENPRGVLLARDELAAWLGSFDRYAHGAADLQFWIEVWNGVQVSRDRVSEGNVTVSHPAVPLTGTIQPETLREKMTGLHFETGFASRLILCQPPTKPKAWTDADVTAALVERYGRLLRLLYALEEPGEPPRRVPLSPDAKAAWIGFFNAENERIHRAPHGPSRAARAKTINHCARLALIVHCCRVADGEREPGALDINALGAAVRMARWCLRETLRVYATLGLGAKPLDPPERFLRGLPASFTTAEALEAATEADVPERTMYQWLSDLQEDGVVVKVGRGRYRKRG